MALRFIISTLVVLALTGGVKGQSDPSRMPGVHVDVVRFQGPDGPYAEVHFFVDGTTLTAVPTPDGQWRSAVDLLLYFARADSVITWDHLILHSPVMEKPGQHLLDVRRYRLPPGTYRMHLEAFDALQPKDTAQSDIPVDVEDFRLAPYSLSDILLLSAVKPSQQDHPLVRNGYLMESLPHRYYGSGQDMLYFYQEIYGVPEVSGSYQFHYYVETGTREGEARRVQQAITKKRKTRHVDPVLLQMDIRHLPSGNYALVTEVRDSQLQLVRQTKALFQRSNPAADALISGAPATAMPVDSFLIDLTLEEINFTLRATAPRVLDKEVDLLNAILRNPDPVAKRHFLYAFFSRLDSRDPMGAYETYMQVARLVDEQYKSGFGYGFESDRGHVLMKYGRPNDIIDVEDEPHAPPYQIWAYDEFPYTGQRNVKFLFYNPSLAPGHYLLLHSTARNERQNPRWEIDLYSRLGGQEIRGVNPQDATGVADQYFRMARKYFEDN